jgi:predicted lipoprotein
MPVSSWTARRALAWAALASAIALAAACTVVRKGEAGEAPSSAAQKAAADESFDAKAYVKKNWARIEPELVKDAIGLREIAGALRDDPAAVEKRYGRRKDETALYNFIVKGDEKVASVYTESSAGYLELDLADASGESKVRIQIGPVFKSTAVRDVLTFISFGDFVNQLDFANIAREINFYVRDNVVASLDKASIVGKRVSFVGAFAEDPSGTILITPVRIGVEP